MNIKVFKTPTCVRLTISFLGGLIDQSLKHLHRKCSFVVMRSSPVHTCFFQASSKLLDLLTFYDDLLPGTKLFSSSFSLASVGKLLAKGIDNFGQCLLIC